EAHADDVGLGTAVEPAGPLDSRGDVVHGAAATGVEHTKGEDGRLRRHADDAGAGVRRAVDRRDRPCDVRAVTVLVLVIGRIDAPAGAAAVAGPFAAADDIRRQVRVTALDAGIEDRDLDARTRGQTGLDVQRVLGAAPYAFSVDLVDAPDPRQGVVE